jgi:hypothetical protein
MRQIVQGFASLHELRVTHGGESQFASEPQRLLIPSDPYPANLGVAAPSLQQFEEEDLMDFFDPLELTPVIPLDPKFDRSQAPPYAVGKVSLTGFLRSEKALPKPKDVQVKIIDFGRCMFLIDSQGIF